MSRRINKKKATKVTDKEVLNSFYGACSNSDEDVSVNPMSLPILNEYVTNDELRSFIDETRTNHNLSIEYSEALDNKVQDLTDLAKLTASRVKNLQRNYVTKAYLQNHYVTDDDFHDSMLESAKTIYQNVDLFVDLRLDKKSLNRTLKHLWTGLLISGAANILTITALLIHTLVH